MHTKFNAKVDIFLQYLQCTSGNFHYTSGNCQLEVAIATCQVAIATCQVEIATCFLKNSMGKTPFFHPEVKGCLILRLQLVQVLGSYPWCLFGLSCPLVFLPLWDAKLQLSFCTQAFQQVVFFAILGQSCSSASAKAFATNSDCVLHPSRPGFFWAAAQLQSKMKKTRAYPQTCHRQVQLSSSADPACPHVAFQVVPQSSYHSKGLMVPWPGFSGRSIAWRLAVM